MLDKDARCLGRDVGSVPWFFQNIVDERWVQKLVEGEGFWDETWVLYGVSIRSCQLGKLHSSKFLLVPFSRVCFEQADGVRAGTGTITVVSSSFFWFFCYL